MKVGIRLLPSFSQMQADQSIIRTSRGKHEESSRPCVKATEENCANVADVHERLFQASIHGDRSYLNTYIRKILGRN